MGVSATAMEPEERRQQPRRSNITAERALHLSADLVEQVKGVAADLRAKGDTATAARLHEVLDSAGDVMRLWGIYHEALLEELKNLRRENT